MSNRTKLQFKSGVVPVPVYVKPMNCGGVCIFCPKEKNIPLGYLENEDTIFARDSDYSPKLQIERYASQIPSELRGKTLPAELIVLGGSFSALDESYRTLFMTNVYESMQHIVHNNRSSVCLIPSIVTVESRPDQINSKECLFLRRLGISKVEIGVQHTNDNVLNCISRGHRQDSVLNATKYLKDNGFKVGYHIMLGLPGSNYSLDEEMLLHTLWKEEYSPDYLKIYPCVLLKNVSLQPNLHTLFETKNWKPIPEFELYSLLTALSNIIPPYVRISRIQRQFDIDSCYFQNMGALRARFGIRFNDVREREVGRKFPYLTLENVGFSTFRMTKKAKDLYLELITTNDTLLGIARIRLRDNFYLVLRELRIFGRLAPLSEKGPFQGNGLGSLFLTKIEEYAYENNILGILVNASIGSRPFFIGKGYCLTQDGYLQKPLIQKDYIDPEIFSPEGNNVFVLKKQ